jgi:ABC-2 type transport system permease protein
MNTLPLLIKREYWEHRAFLWTPVWITGAILIITLLGIISAETFAGRANVHIGVSLDDLRLGAGQFAEFSNGLDTAQLVFTAMSWIGVFAVSFFYLLGSLYDDRRDRSVLFWKSLPISDTATVASKALTAMLVIPALALAVSTLAYIAFVALIVLWVGAHGINALPGVIGAHPFAMFGRLLLMLPVGALWALPTIGWLMFWSAYARSKPVKWALLLPFIAVAANAWLSALGGPHIGGDVSFAKIFLVRLLFSVMPGSWMYSGFGIDMSGIHMSFNPEDRHVVDMFGLGQIGAALSSANLWLGVIAGIALLAVAVWLRGRRIETNV